MPQTKANSKQKKALGRGLGAFFDDVEVKESALVTAKEVPEEVDGKGVVEIKIRDIEPNPEQPRKLFDKEKLEALASSISEHGLIQPVLVKKADHGMYMIIAGERRWRAAKLAGLSKIPCVVGEYSGKEIMEIALIENLQREDLDPIEESEGYRSLIEAFSLTQDEVAKRLGKSRSAVANSLRLAGLSEKIKTMVKEKKISQGHARALLSLDKESERLAVVERIIKEDLNVRQVESLVSTMQKNKGTKPAKKTVDKNVENYFRTLANDLSAKLGTKVLIKHGKKRGKIEIEYYSNEELENILKKIK